MNRNRVTAHPTRQGASLEARNPSPNYLVPGPPRRFQNTAQNFHRGTLDTPSSRADFSSKKNGPTWGWAALLAVTSLSPPILLPRRQNARRTLLFGMPFDKTADDGKKLWDRFVLADEAIHVPHCVRHVPGIEDKGHIRLDYFQSSGECQPGSA